MMDISFHCTKHLIFITEEEDHWKLSYHDLGVSDFLLSLRQRPRNKFTVNA